MKRVPKLFEIRGLKLRGSPPHPMASQLSVNNSRPARNIYFSCPVIKILLDKKEINQQFRRKITIFVTPPYFQAIELSLWATVFLGINVRKGCPI